MFDVIYYAVGQHYTRGESMLGGFARCYFKGYEDRRGNGPRVIDQDFSWHYPVSTDKQYEEALAILRNGVQSSEITAEKSVRSSTSMAPQPIWNLLEPPNPFHFDELKRRSELNPEAVQPGGFDVWACYKPFHNDTRPAGINMWPEGVAGCAHALQRAYAGDTENDDLTMRAAVVWAMSLLYLHELIHQVVEDVVTVFEFRTGTELYLPAQKRWSGYILMEEALANSFARSRQKNFFNRRKPETTYEQERRHQAENDGKPYTADKEPIIKRAKLLDALDSAMRAQPPGYRDYVDFGARAEQLFCENLMSLLAYVYLPCGLYGRHRIGDDAKLALHTYSLELHHILHGTTLSEGLRDWRHEDVVLWFGTDS